MWEDSQKFKEHKANLKNEDTMNFRKNRKLYKKENVIIVYLAQVTNIYVVIIKHLIWNYPNSVSS